MDESQIVATDRLRIEGRWEEASLYRDQMRKQLRAEGKSKAEAREASWAAMLVKFSPLPAEVCGEDESETEAAQAELAELVARTEGQEAFLVNDLHWAYENYLDDSITPQDAPSRGAWMTMKFARSSPNKFMELVFGKLLPRQEEREQKKAKRKDLGLDEVRRMLEAAEEDAAAERKQKLLGNTSKAVIDSVQKVVSNFAGPSDGELGSKAAESLELQMIDLVNKTIAVAVEEPEAFRVGA